MDFGMVLICKVFVLQCFFSLAEVESPTSRLWCPEKWREGDTAILKCTIKVTEYTNTSCQQFPDLVDFQFTPKQQSIPSSECAVHGLTKTCDGRFQPGNCRCREVSDGRYVLEFAVTALRERHAGGTWKCVPGCSDRFFRNPFLYGESEEALTCSPVEFDNCGSSAMPSIVSQKTFNRTAVLYLKHFMAHFFQPFVVTQMFYIMNFL